MEYKVIIGGVEYGMKDIESVSIETPLFDKLSAGNACSSELTISFWPTQTVPRMAEIVPFARKSESDEWTQLGVYYTDERSTSAGGKMNIVAYDAMLKSEAVWVPAEDLEFPLSMPAAATAIASEMGVTVDARTTLNAEYTVDYPANEYTLRDVLRFMGAAHAGNWIMTAQNELLLVPLFTSMPEETYNLTTEDGDTITFGGVKIVV